LLQLYWLLVGGGLNVDIVMCDVVGEEEEKVIRRPKVLCCVAGVRVQVCESEVRREWRVWDCDWRDLRFTKGKKRRVEQGVRKRRRERRKVYTFPVGRKKCCAGFWKWNDECDDERRKEGRKRSSGEEV